MKLKLVGKKKGVFENYPYFNLCFLKECKDGEGFEPYVRYSYGKPKIAQPCLPDVYEKFIVGDEYDSDLFTLNPYGKIVDYRG